MGQIQQSIFYIYIEVKDLYTSTEDKVRKERFVYAAKGGKIKLMTKLINGLTEEMKSSGKFYDEPDVNGQAPLFFACRHGNEDVVQMLLKTGANKNRLDECGHTPLYEACKNHRLWAVQKLIEAGADMERAGTFKYPEKGNFVSKLIEAKRKGELMVKDDTVGESPLHRACEKGFLDIVIYLHQAGADMDKRINDAQTSWGDTPLHKAVMGGQLHVVVYLVEEVGVIIDSVDEDDNTPLHKAAYKGFLPIVDYLIRM